VAQTEPTSNQDDRALSGISLLDPEVQREPWNFYERLQNEQPVHKMPGTNIYVLTRYEDVRAAVADTKTFSNVVLAMEALQADGARRYQAMLKERGWEHVHVLHRADPPTHTAHRKLVDRVFNAKRVRELLPAIEALANQLVDRFIDRGECELIAEFALPLPGRIIGGQLGLDANEFARFQKWALVMLSTGNEVMSDERLREMAEIELDAQHYLAKIFEDRRQHPTEDLISALVHAAQPGEEPFNMHQLQNLLHQLITGGYETTTSAIAHGMWALMRWPDQLAKLRERPELLKNFVEEVLRFESPVQGLMRTVTRDVTVADFPLKKGDIVLLRWGAANQDPKRFPSPRTFDIERKNAGSHLAFGFGAHACIGQQLARQEIFTGVKVLLERIKSFELARPLPEMPYVRSLNFMPLKEMPIRFTRV
jgi:cytochrome P450